MSDPTPAVFVGHGSPMNAIEHNRYTDAWQAFGAGIARPRALLVISAHWYINASAVTAMTAPRTIHDFYGFPDELFAVDYPAPGAPDLAEEVADLVKPTWVGLDHDSWGIDHGTWSVLVHAFPDADIPVVQLSINASKSLDHHLDLGARLAPLRDSGVLIVGSGNVVHNLRQMNWSAADTGEAWAQRFDDEARSVMTSSPGDAVGLQAQADFHRCVPTPDHFIPLLYLAGLAGVAGRPTEILVDGYAYGSLSMTSFTLDAHPPAQGAARPQDPDAAASDAAAAVGPVGVPADESNI